LAFQHLCVLAVALAAGSAPQIPPPETVPHRYGGLSAATRAADLVVRVEVLKREVINMPAGHDWRDAPTDAMEAKYELGVKAWYRPLGPPKETVLTAFIPLKGYERYFEEELQPVGHLFFWRDLSPHDDRIVFLKKRNDRLYVQHVIPVSFTGTLSSDELMRRMIEMSGLSAERTALELTDMLATLYLNATPEGGDWPLQRVLVDDWERHRSFLPASSPALSSILDGVFPLVVSDARHYGGTFELSTRFATLMSEDRRKEIVAALLAQERDVSSEYAELSLHPPKPAREMTFEMWRFTHLGSLRSLLPRTMASLMGWNINYQTGTAERDSIPNAACEFSEHARAWAEFADARERRLADLEKARQAAATATEASADLGRLVASASDIVLAEPSSGALGPNYRWLSFKVLDRLRDSSEQSSGVERSYFWVKVPLDADPLVNRYATSAQPNQRFLVFLRAVPEDIWRKWPAYQPTLDDTDKRRFEFINYETALLPATQERIESLTKVLRDRAVPPA
jgi:hypothetical protein